MFEETSDVPKTEPKREDTRCLDSHHEVFVIALVMECPSMYLHEMCKAIEVATRVCVSEATVCKILRKNGLTRNKIRTVAVERRAEYRASFMARALSFEREMLVFLDETGSDARNYTRKFGYSLRGLRAESHQIVRRISAIAAIDCFGTVCVELTYESVDADCFFDCTRYFASTVTAI